MRLLLLFTAVTFLVSSSFAQMNESKYLFDTGKDGENKITADYMYSPESGYGWLIKPEYEFRRNNLSKSREEFLIDGVTGKELLFKADLPPAGYHITLWIEAGFEDSSTVQISINDEVQKKNWQAFSPPAEPRENIQKIFRVYSGSFNLSSTPLELKITSELDSVRLLGFSIIPEKKNLSENEKEILNELKEAGKFNSSADLSKSKIKLQDLLAENKNDSFALHWLEQINILIKAESMLDMMGWEWATKQTGMGIFDRYFQIVMLTDAIVNQNNSPFYERALWIRSKLLYWLDLERGVEHEKAVSSRGLKELYDKYPGDKLLAMYNGEKVNLPGKCDSLDIAENAPLWSKLQYESLFRLRSEIDWWVNVRQAENGEFGGKLGDDVELLRGWPPAVAAGDETALAGWKKLADCVWNSPQLYNGYSKEADDVEHSSEFISDTTPELTFFTDDNKYVERVKYSADYFGNLWTGIADNGKRYFKSAWFSSTEIDTVPPKNRDVEMNTRAAKAVRYYAWKTGDEKTVKLMHEWALGWVDAAMRTDKGKPAGIIPPSVRFPDAAVNGDEQTWYIADMYWDYFDWQHSAGSKMHDQLLFTYLLTGDTVLLKPLILSLEMISKYEDHSGDEIKKGSEEWAAEILKRKKEFWNTVEQYRFLTSDNRFDNLILKYGTPYSRYRLTGDTKIIEDALNEYLNHIRFNTPLRTSEVLHTDRVYYPGGEYIKAMLTGDGTNEGTSPYYAVSWEKTNGAVTALVDETGKEKLTVKVFSHSLKNIETVLRIWQLQNGSYTLEYKNENGSVSQKKIEISERGERINLELPSRELLTISIKPVE